MDSFGVFATALIASLILTPLVCRIARARGFVDDPGLRKVHTEAIPDVGGVAFVLAMLLGLAAFFVLFPGHLEGFWSAPERGLAVVGAMLVMFAVGFIDDVRGLRVRQKLVVQILVAIALCALGLRIEEVRVAQGIVLEFGWFAWPLTIFWVVGVTNAFNLIDGLDGLAGGLAAVACAVLAVLGFEYEQLILAGMGLAMLGALIGFLVFNLHPARIIMGDGGSLALGVFLAAGSIVSQRAEPSHFYTSIALPMLAMGIPILDAIYCVVRRILDRRSPFAPDRGHIHHRLLEVGLDQRRIVLLMHVTALLAAGIGLFMFRWGGVLRLVVFLAAFSSILFLFWGVGYFRFRKTFTSLAQMTAIARETRAAQRSFELLQLEMREVMNFEQWWRVICGAAAALEFDTVELEVEAREGPGRKLSWCNPEPDAGEILSMQVPIPQRRCDQPLVADVAVRTKGSLEAAARRFRLFARLIDEHSVRSLAPPADAADGGEVKTQS